MNELKRKYLKSKTLYEIAEKRNCTGCGACVCVCPRQCIHMTENEEGFLYPRIDHDLCINCGLCLKSCPSEPADDKKVQAIRAGYSRDPAIRKESSSGGIFSHLAEAVLKKDGVIFGVKMKDNRAVTCEINQVKDLQSLRGSKYIQSRTEAAYIYAQKRLEEGRWVLFSGTPCQIAGLYRVLKKDYPRLITVDIICHGVSSPIVLDKYLRETGGGKKACRISFRDKENGWEKFCMKVNWEDNTDSCISLSEDLYLQSFLRNLNLRPSCFSCKFRKIHRVSDITLGDLWGVEEIIKEWNDDLGYSLVILQSKEGAELWNEMKEQVISLPIELSQILSHNASLQTSPWDTYSRELFFRYLPHHDLRYCIQKAAKDNIAKKIRRKLWKALNNPL